MSFEQKFDKIIKHKIEEAEFPFDEANWAKANKMLDAEKGISAGKNAKVFLLAAAIILMLGTGGFFTFKYFENASSANSETKQMTENATVINNASNSDNNTANSVKNNAPNNTVVNTAVTESKTKNNGKDSKNRSSINSSDNSELGAISNSSADRKYSTNSNNSSATSENAMAKNSVPSVENNSANTSNSGENNNSSASTNSSKKNGNAKDNQAMAKVNTRPSKIKPVIGKNQSKGGYINDVNDSPVMYEEQVLNYDESDYRLLASKMKMPFGDLDSFSLKKTPYDFIRIYDDDYYKSVRKRKTHFMNVEGGMAYMLGWNVPVGKDAKGFNVYMGANYGVHASKRISASIGAQFYNIGNIEQPFYTGSNVTYGFGSNGTYTSVASNSLFYFSVPVKVDFALTKYDHIGASVNTGVLFNGMNTVATYEMKDGVKSNESKTRYTGYFEGTNTTNIMLGVSYGHSFSKRVRVNGEFMYSISDTYKNTATSAAKENNMGIRLGVQYTLFDK